MNMLLIVALTFVVLPTVAKRLVSIHELTDRSLKLESDELPLVTAKMSFLAYGGQDAESKVMREELTRDGWNVTKKFSLWGAGESLKTDGAILYKKNTQCVLAFAGSDGGFDFLHDSQTGTCTDMDFSYCQFMAKTGLPPVSRGIAKEFVPVYEVIKKNNGLAELAQCRKLTVTGHSLGGALATVFAAWANQKDKPMEASVKVDNVYTIGAIPVSSAPLTNGQNASGCFAGMRYFNRGTYDDFDFAIFIGGPMVDIPVDIFYLWTRVLSLGKYMWPLHHPKIPAHGLSEKQEEDEDLDCGEACANAIHPKHSKNKENIIPNPILHSSLTYVKRIEARLRRERQQLGRSPFQVEPLIKYGSLGVRT